MFQFLTTEKFIEKAKSIHGNKYDYSKVDYKGTKHHITVICPDHGEFTQIPNNHLSGNGCKNCFSYRQHINHVSSKEEFINKALFKHSSKYDYSKVNYINAVTKVIITCPIHGEFEQTPKGHLSGYGCIKCLQDNELVKIPLQLSDFIQRANRVHNFKYEYTKTSYINARTKVLITCKEHGDFKQKPFNHLNGKGCPGCNASKGESIIKNILNKNNINCEPQYRIPDEKYLLYYDFYLPELNILIEYHGIQHYKWIPYFQKTYHDFEKQQMRDNNKITLAKAKGISLVEFNYKQLKELTIDEFKHFVLKRIQERIHS